MATLKEVEKQLKEAKKELRELRTHNKFLLERLELGHERAFELRQKIMTMTFDDIIKNQQELSKYQEKMAKDKELVDTFENQVKQSEKLNAL
jgi:DNA-binding protein H-NS